MEGEHGNGEGCHSCHCYSNPQVLCVLGFLSGTLLINSFFVFVFFQFKKVLFLHTKGHVGSFPLQGLNPGPLHWKHSLNHWTTREVQDFLSDGNFNRLVVPVWSLVCLVTGVHYHLMVVHYHLILTIGQRYFSEHIFLMNSIPTEVLPHDTKARGSCQGQLSTKVPMVSCAKAGPSLP